jgi:hypothetical protein
MYGTGDLVQLGADGDEINVDNFNELIKPRDGSTWSAHNPHSITAEAVKFKDGVQLVFARFITWILCIVQQGFTDIVLTAWNGKRPVSHCIFCSFFLLFFPRSLLLRPFNEPKPEHVYSFVFMGAWAAVILIGFTK